MKFLIPEFLRKKMEEIIAENPVIYEEPDDGCEEDFDEGVSQEELEKLPVYQTLLSSVQEGMSLDQLIDAFASMCKLPVGEPDDLLFETGTYNFTGPKLFYFSLVRQFQYRDEDEYVQLHLDIRYTPSPATARLESTEWGSLTEGDFFNMVRSSAAYRQVRDLPMAQVEVYIEET